MKADLYNHEARWERWKEEHKNKNIEGLTKTTSDLIKQYLYDMENGENVSTRNKRGGRSKSRLNKIAYTITWVCLRLREHYKVADITKATSKDLLELFRKMRSGELKTIKGTKFKATSDYVKVTKAFFHWYQKINRKKGIFLQDITEDLDAKYDEKPKWVYLNEPQMEELIEKANPYYKPVMSFLYDSGARPTETFSILVRDISINGQGEVFVDIRNEVSKGGDCGRKIKLLLSGKQIIQYIKDKGLNPEDNLFSQSSTVINRYLGSFAQELFGDRVTQAGNKFSNLSLYDFRHNSACFWVNRYKKNAHLMYRFGWKTEKYIHYYTEFLGLRDKISQEDMYTDITKTELEKKVKSLEAGLNLALNTIKKIVLTPESVKEIKPQTIEELKNFNQ